MFCSTVVGNHLSAMKNDDVRANTFYGLEFVRAKDDHLATPCQFLNQAAQNQAGGDIQPGEWFIQQQQLGVVKQRGTKQYLLAHSF